VAKEWSQSHHRNQRCTDLDEFSGCSIGKLQCGGNKPLWFCDQPGGTGGSGDDFLSSLQQTSNSGYIFAGYSYSGISGNKTTAGYGGADYWVVKVDAIGNKVWDKAFGGSSEDYLFTVQQTSDGGYILGGATSAPVSGNKTSPSYGDFDCWVVKTYASGNKQWDDIDGTVTQVALLSGTNLIATLTNEPFNFTWTNAPLGTNILTVVATDDRGDSVTSAPVTVTMTLPQPGLPEFSLSTNSYLDRLPEIISG
jgi:hypothetical protein